MSATKDLRIPALLLGLFVAAGLIASGYLLGNAALKVKSLDRTVTVKGLSEREVPADLAAWPLNFQAAANDIDEIYAAVETNVATIRRFLQTYGVSPDEITLSPPQVTDLHAQNWGDKRHLKFRYTANATVTVYTDKVDAVRDAMANIIDLGKQGVVIGGNQYSGPGSNLFLFTGLSGIKPEMIEEATKNARAVAKKFAQDSDSNLGKIRSARQGVFSINDRDATTPHIKKVRVVSTIEYYLTD